jgi:hypothetical protein
MREGPGAFPFLEMGAQSRDRSAGTGEDNGTGGAKLSPEGGRACWHLAVLHFWGGG